MMSGKNPGYSSQLLAWIRQLSEIVNGIAGFSGRYPFAYVRCLIPLVEHARYVGGLFDGIVRKGSIS
jgi:hypothetical protein